MQATHRDDAEEAGDLAAAGREPLIDARNVAADLECVCPHSAYRRRGVARAAIGSRRMTHSPGSTVPPSIAATASNPKRR